MKSLVILAIILLFTTNALSSDDEREHIKKLDDLCLEVRTEKLKVVQQEKIEKCVNIDEKDREYCERYFKNYGWGSRSASGYRNVRLFDQIPECIEAFNARKNRKR